MLWEVLLYVLIMLGEKHRQFVIIFHIVIALLFLPLSKTIFTKHGTQKRGSRFRQSNPVPAGNGIPWTPYNYKKRKEKKDKHCCFFKNQSPLFASHDKKNNHIWAIIRIGRDKRLFDFTPPPPPIIIARGNLSSPHLKKE